MSFLINPYSVQAAVASFANAYSIDCDGVNDYAESADSIATIGLSSTNTFSVSFWIKCTTAPASWDGFIGATTSINWNDGFGFYHVSNNLYFFVNHYHSNKAYVGYTAATTAQNWNHIVGVYDGTLGSANIKLYINGVAQGILVFGIPCCYPVFPVFLVEKLFQPIYESLYCFLQPFHG